MFLRIIRDLTPEEVLEKIRKFEKEVGMSFEKFEEAFVKKRPDSKFARIYFEWAELLDSYKGYIEDGQLDYAVEEVKDFKLEDVALLTSKRIQLLYQLAAMRVQSINDLAKKTRRDVKNVYQDLKVLRRLDFIRLNRRKGRALVPETLVKEITFLVR